ncbi:aldehyde dehydrogenase [Haloarcula marismortui ATCC 43049]|uniref:Aldehyde dehydrogenase n=2 Tax=Haloarcula marismortui (strain ATCC 43049 / DSM 3752 / JCM 8966 / VKM B-1809) TaxID=272569 RepID=Q5UWQ8_HALMA|nr:aldehyde dehydrogenase [Haloarcula marismortui ATCC 43049]
MKYNIISTNYLLSRDKYCYWPSMSTASDDSTETDSAIKQRHRDAAADAIPDNLSHYIGGEFVAGNSHKTIETRDPTTDAVLGEVPAGNAADIDDAVKAAQQAFDGGWKDASPGERQRVLSEMAHAVEENRKTLATLEVLDTGKTITEAMGDMGLVIDHLTYYAAAARNVNGETRQTNDLFDREKQVFTVKEPYGVVGAIVPWNFPLLIAIWKCGPALAAGNTVVLKPSEETPLSTLKLMELVDNTVPDGVINVVTGYGEDAGAPLSTHEDVPKISFTGSTEVGKEIIRNSAEDIKKTTLELGGKSPVIVYPDADLEEAVEAAMMAIFFNKGECCAAGSRLFVHEDIEEQFLETFTNAASGMTVGDPLLEETDMGPKVSDEQVQRTNEFVEAARESGATIRTGGSAPDDESLAGGAFYEPTVIDDIDHDHPSVQKEIFGPVMETFSWSDEDDVVELANDVDYGLAAGVISGDVTKALQTARRLEAGVVWVNHYNDVSAGQPFGGYKQSGTGRENAAEAIDEFTQTKAINVNLG